MGDLKKEVKVLRVSVFDHAIVFDVDALRRHLNESTFVQLMCENEAFILL